MFQWIKRVWDRVTSPDKIRARPGWFNPRTDAGTYVDHENALKQAAVWACVRVIAESLSQLPWRCFQRTERGNQVLDSHPADRLLYSSPNEWLTPAVWKELMLHDVLLWGNSYHEIMFDGSRRPIGLYRIGPDRVTPFMAQNGMMYLVKNQGRDDSVLFPEEVFHVRGLGDDLAGWSVIQHACQAIGLATAQDQSMASLIANGSRPAGIITPTGQLGEAAADRVREQWEAVYGGSKNKGKTALLSHSMKYEPLGLPNTDAQMLESRRFSVLEICRFFRVPPHKIMDLERATFSNIEHQAIEFVQDTLVPWAVKMEQEANRKLIAAPNRGKMFTKINFNALLRGDFESRAKAYQTLMDRGVYSVNDVLELEDRNTIGPDGDIRLVPLNMQTLERANEPPEPPHPPPAPTDPGDEEDEDEQDENAMLAYYRPILQDCVDRMTAREMNMMRSQNASKFDHGHTKWLTDQLAPHAAAIAVMTGKPINVAKWAEDRCTELHAETKAHLAAGGEMSELFSLWSDRVERTTDELLGVQNVPV